MIDLDAVTAACGVLVDPDGGEGFAHLATAWCVGPGEWLTAWEDDEPPSPTAGLMSARDGGLHALDGWERDGPVAAFRCAGRAPALPLGDDAALRKRVPLEAVGYPSVIDHPAVHLHRGSLDPERYFPYLCPWRVPGHLALFTAEEGFLTGRIYRGMAGGPVIAAGGGVVGLLLDPVGNDGPHPPLGRFRRIAAGG